jgi:hypothetical protein
MTETETIVILPALFHHHFIVDGIEDEPNSRYGTPVLADFDNDGDLDYSFSITRSSLSLLLGDAAATSLRLRNLTSLFRLRERFCSWKRGLSFRIEKVADW